MEIKFTKTEQEVLMHRLSVPDCIADALDGLFDDLDATDDLSGWTREDIIAEVNEIRENIEISGGRLDVGMLPAMGKVILADALEGSTYCADIQYHYSARSAAITRKTIMSLRKKLVAAGIEIGEVPLN